MNSISSFTWLSASGQGKDLCMWQWSQWRIKWDWSRIIWIGDEGKINIQWLVIKGCWRLMAAAGKMSQSSSHMGLETSQWAPLFPCDPNIPGKICVFLDWLAKTYMWLLWSLACCHTGGGFELSLSYSETVNSVTQTANVDHFPWQ